MISSTENDSKLLGAKETMKSKSFLDRIAVKKSINYSDCGNGPLFRYQWADYKTSVLCQEMNKQSVANFDQQVFIQKMINNILVVLRVDLHIILNEYMVELETAQQKGNARSYPVSQSQVWRNNARGVWNNTYGLINFLKWIWFKLYLGRFYGTVSCDDSSLLYYLLIETFQQMIFKVQSNIKGPRRNENKNDTGLKTTNVGISDIFTVDLMRSINDNNTLPVEVWTHPAKTQCFVPYFGGYGAMIKKYREDPGNNKYSSLKCGISGSVNYFIFLYLLNTIVSEDKSLEYNPKRLLILMTMILAGDGGHNVREILFGTASVVIVLKHLLIDTLAELRAHYNNPDLTFKEAVTHFKNTGDFSWITNDSIIGAILNRIVVNIGDKLDNCSNVKIKESGPLYMLLLILNAFSNWENPINELYNLTADMNIVGLDSKDISDAGLSINDFDYCKRQTYSVLFGIKTYDIDHTTKKVMDIPLANSVQVFYALDNNRFLGKKSDTFKKSADKCMTNIINFMYEGIYDTVNAKAKRHLSKCVPDSKMSHIPFA